VHYGILKLLLTPNNAQSCHLFILLVLTCFGVVAIFHRAGSNLDQGRIDVCKQELNLVVDIAGGKEDEGV